MTQLCVERSGACRLHLQRPVQQSALSGRPEGVGLECTSASFIVNAPMHLPFTQLEEPARDASERLQWDARAAGLQPREQVAPTSRREDEANYAWERRYERSWEAIGVSDAGGGIFRRDALDQQRQRHRDLERVLQDSAASAARRRVGRALGLIRFLVLALDLSAAVRSRSRSSLSSSSQDLKPSRWSAILSGAQYFVQDFFSENAVSQLAIVILQDGIAAQVSEMSGSVRLHIDALRSLQRGTNKFLHDGDGGQTSLQNCLELGLRIHASVPRFGTREMLIVYGGLSTCDPGDIHKTIQNCVDASIRVSVIGLGAEVYILRATAERTQGTYRVPMDNDHFHQLLRQQVPPPPPPPQASRSTKHLEPSEAPWTAMQMVMGFPPKLARDRVVVAIDTRKACRLGFECPRCRQWLSEVPGNCILCGLTLTSVLHLARSYHHIFPAPRFEEREEPSSSRASALMSDEEGFSVSPSSVPERMPDAAAPPVKWQCSGCSRTLSTKDDLQLQCTGICRQLFCIDCDQLVHERLHTCPACLAMSLNMRQRSIPRTIT
jgi:transcription initiation factor TFIIH subunit 2